MKAVIVKSPGGAEQLKISEVPMPVPDENEALIKVRATALNRADILQREGKYPPPKGATSILGLEIAGDVYSVGKKVANLKVGDKIFGLLPGGGYAEYAVINAMMANQIPKGLSYEEASAIPEVFLTAYQALIWHAGIQHGEKILIHAGASGVGTAAIQIARLIGAEIFITASSGKHEMCRILGANYTIDYRHDDFSSRILEWTDQQGIDVILDFIAGPYFNKNLKSLRMDGRLIMLATLGGGHIVDADIRQILSKRLKIIGSTLRSRTLDYQIRLNMDFCGFALDKFENQVLNPVVDKIFNWKDVSEAHRYMEADKNIGKIVLSITE